MNLLYCISLITGIICSSAFAATHVKNLSDLIRGGKPASSVFQKELSANKLVVVKCSMKNCGPCKKIAPQFEALAAKYQGVAEFIELDVHLFDDIIKPFDIKSAPSFIIFYNGRHAKTLRGSASVNDISTILDTQLKKEANAKA